MRSTKGQALVEFALIAPIIVILLVGIIDFGMALDRRIRLQHAVREGARYGAVTATCPPVQQRTLDRAGNIIDDPGDVTVSYYKPDDSPIPPGTSAIPGDVVKVSTPFEWEFPLVSRFGVGPIDVNVSASARLELAVSPDDIGDCQ